MLSEHGGILTKKDSRESGMTGCSCSNRLLRPEKVVGEWGIFVRRRWAFEAYLDLHTRSVRHDSLQSAGTRQPVLLLG